MRFTFTKTLKKKTKGQIEQEIWDFHTKKVALTAGKNRYTDRKQDQTRNKYNPTSQDTAYLRLFYYLLVISFTRLDDLALGTACFIVFFSGCTLAVVVHILFCTLCR